MSAKISFGGYSKKWLKKTMAIILLKKLKLRSGSYLEGEEGSQFCRRSSWSYDSSENEAISVCGEETNRRNENIESQSPAKANLTSEDCRRGVPSKLKIISRSDLKRRSINKLWRKSNRASAACEEKPAYQPGDEKQSCGCGGGLWKRQTLGVAGKSKWQQRNLRCCTSEERRYEGKSKKTKAQSEGEKKEEKIKPEEEMIINVLKWKLNQY